MVEVEAVETPAYLAWVQQQKAGEDQRRAELVQESWRWGLRKP